MARPDAIPEAPARLRAWLADGRHGDMDWMGEAVDRRASPAGLWPQVRSVVMLGMSYAPGVDPLASLGLPDRATISVYARSRDYHDVVKGKLKQVAGALAAAGAGVGVKVFVDTAPVLEKPLAAAAGLGWQGKHTVLVSREHGSWLFLGALYTTAELEPDAPARTIAAPAGAAAARLCSGKQPVTAAPEWQSHQGRGMTSRTHEDA